jgi:hypothetical protein
MPYVRAALAESLRMYPQPPILIRRSLGEDVLPAPLNGDPAGYPIGKGADIFISVWNLHRCAGCLSGDASVLWTSFKQICIFSDGHLVPSIPAGCRYALPGLMVPCSLCRSPYLWKDPDVFWPERFSKANSNADFDGAWAGYRPEAQGSSMYPNEVSCRKQRILLLGNHLA